jgi:hypothetical protein
MTKKTYIPLLASVVTLLLTAAPPATAGTYTVHSCQTPSGTFVGDEGWTALAATSEPNRDGGVIEACTLLGSPMGIRFGDVQLPANPGVGRSWRFDAAPDTTIASASLARTFELGWPIEDGVYGRGYVVDAWHDEDEISHRLEFRAPPWGGRTDSSNSGTHVTGAGGTWESVSFRLRCWESNGDALCGPFRATLAVSRATFGISDSQTPSGNVDVSGLATVVRGTVGVGVSASDVGGGVYRAIVSVDGAEVAREVLDGNGGRCGDVEPGNGDAYEFATPQPCALSAAGEVALDTSGLLDGQHQLRVEVEDAAGNVTLLHEGAFTSRNGPTATVAPRISGGDGTRVGDVLIALEGSWDGDPDRVTLQWLRCDAAGAGCRAVSGAIGGIYAVTPVDAGGRVVLEEIAENANGEGSVRSEPTTIVAPKDDERDPTPDPPVDGGRRDGDPAPGGDAPPVTPAAGGVDGLRNPVAGQGGNAPNGDGASAQARLTLRVRLAGGGTATRARGRHARRWTVTGRLLAPDGSAISDARVNLVTRVGAGRWKAGAVVRTGTDGRFARTLAAGPSRQVRATYFPFADSRSFRSSNLVGIESLAPLTIRADRGRVAGGGTVRLAGRAGGARIPRGGLLVALQGHQTGWGWRTFRTVRTNAAGTWKSSYRFRSRAGRFAFRAVVPRQAGYPFAASTSTAVSVRVG